ncbi:MAG: heparan-alpha-glucosaminide N-acetyltransferase domain-containing protein [Muribaculaceae bacterium]|nr:heparan-alpha-glucosaminide N-acetyltransferase domain-containing protein [Muribaculaceae bacterium]
MAENKRLLSLDIMRGITIAGMIMVNNSGSGTHYEPLGHADWNGLTPTDLVFPFFMFIMGVSCCLSLRKFDFRPSSQVIIKIIRRAILIFAIGLAIAWFGMFFRGLMNGQAFVEAFMPFGNIRILGVLQRLALCYGIGALIAVTINHKRLPWIIASMLIIYAIMIVIGNGYDNENYDSNIITIVDRAVLTSNHMYRPNFDPEGFLSTLPSIAHMLIGFCCGNMILRHKDNHRRVELMLLTGTALMFAGLLLSYGFPINKKIWSPTFVLTTCGMAAGLLGLLIWIIDIRGYRRWTGFFHVFGVNPLFLYVLAAVLSITVGAITTVNAAGETVSLKKCFYYDTLVPLLGGDLKLASLIYALLMVTVCWAVGLVLYRRRIYIKI